MIFICFVVEKNFRSDALEGQDYIRVVTIKWASPGNGDVVMQILIKWYHTKVSYKNKTKKVF